MYRTYIVRNEKMKRGFYSALIVAMATAVLLFAVAMSYSAGNAKTTAVSEYSMQKAADRMDDATEMLWETYVDALVDSAYESDGCPPAPGQFCTKLQNRLPNYLNKAATELSKDAANVTYLSTEVACGDNPPGSKIFYAEYDFEIRVRIGNSTMVKIIKSTPGDGARADIVKRTGAQNFKVTAGLPLGWDYYHHSRQFEVDKDTC